MTSTANRVSKFYNSNCIEEDRRLQDNSLEFLMTYKTILRNVEPKSCILDMGGATGRYAIPLAIDGHHVTLVDISDKELEIARVKASGLIQSLDIKKGDAISYNDYLTYDAVLCLGPLYHCSSEQEILSIVENMLSVLKFGGKLFLSFVSKFAKFTNSIEKLQIGDVCDFDHLNDYWRLRNAQDDTFCFEFRDSLPITLTHPLLLSCYLKKHNWQTKDVFTVDLYKNHFVDQFTNKHYEWLHTLGADYMLSMGEHILVVIEKS